MQNLHLTWEQLVYAGIGVLLLLLVLARPQRDPRIPLSRYLRAFLALLALGWAGVLGLGLYLAGLPRDQALAVFFCGILVPAVALLVLVDLECFGARALDNRLGRFLYRRVAGLRLDPRQLLRVQNLGHCRTCDNVYVVPWFARRWMRQCPNCSNALSKLSMAEATAMRRDAGNYQILNEQFEELLEEKRAFEPEDDIKARPGRQ